MATTSHRLNPCADISSSSLITGELVDENLVIRRRLGKTNLSVKPSQIGTSNATKEGNLGLFEYAHLRVKLPEDLTGSEIFPSHASMTPPETYFLMVRYIFHIPTTGQSLNCRVFYTAPQHGWVRQCYWHVQDCIPLGQDRRGKERTRILENLRAYQRGRGRR